MMMAKLLWSELREATTTNSIKNKGKGGAVPLEAKLLCNDPLEAGFGWGRVVWHHES